VQQFGLAAAAMPQPQFADQQIDDDADEREHQYDEQPRQRHADRQSAHDDAYRQPQPDQEIHEEYQGGDPADVEHADSS
jgi:hypothetical protein